MRTSYLIVFPAAILDFRLKEASEEDGIGAVETPAPENMGVGAGILFLSSTELEKPWGVILILPPALRVVTKGFKIGGYFIQR